MNRIGITRPPAGSAGAPRPRGAEAGHGWSGAGNPLGGPRTRRGGQARGPSLDRADAGGSGLPPVAADPCTRSDALGRAPARRLDFGRDPVRRAEVARRGYLASDAATARTKGLPGDLPGRSGLRAVFDRAADREARDAARWRDLGRAGRPAGTDRRAGRCEGERVLAPRAFDCLGANAPGAGAPRVRRSAAARRGTLRIAAMRPALEGRAPLLDDRARADGGAAADRRHFASTRGPGTALRAPGPRPAGPSLSGARAAGRLHVPRTESPAAGTARARCGTRSVHAPAGARRVA